MNKPCTVAADSAVQTEPTHLHCALTGAVMPLETSDDGCGVDDAFAALVKFSPCGSRLLLVSTERKFSCYSAADGARLWLHTQFFLMEHDCLKDMGGLEPLELYFECYHIRYSQAWHHGQHEVLAGGYVCGPLSRPLCMRTHGLYLAAFDSLTGARHSGHLINFAGIDVLAAWTLELGDAFPCYSCFNPRGSMLAMNIYRNDSRGDLFGAPCILVVDSRACVVLTVTILIDAVHVTLPSLQDVPAFDWSLQGNMLATPSLIMHLQGTFVKEVQVGYDFGETEVVDNVAFDRMGCLVAFTAWASDGHAHAVFIDAASGHEMLSVSSHKFGAFLCSHSSWALIIQTVGSSDAVPNVAAIWDICKQEQLRTFMLNTWQPQMVLSDQLMFGPVSHTSSATCYPGCIEHFRFWHTKNMSAAGLRLDSLNLSWIGRPYTSAALGTGHWDAYPWSPDQCVFVALAAQERESRPHAVVNGESTPPTRKLFLVKLC